MIGKVLPGIVRYSASRQLLFSNKSFLVSSSYLHRSNPFYFKREIPFGHTRKAKWGPKSPLEDWIKVLLIAGVLYFAFDWRYMYHEYPKAIVQKFRTIVPATLPYRLLFGPTPTINPIEFEKDDDGDDGDD